MSRGFKDIFLVVFPLTALLFGVMTYFLLQLNTLGSKGFMMALGLGFSCGIVFGCGVGYYVRTLEFDFEVDHQHTDVYTRLQLTLLEMGYRLDNHFQRVITFEPTMRAGIFADHIRVEMAPGRIIIGGPRWHLEKLRDKLGI
jgi:hypothetical protein